MKKNLLIGIIILTLAGFTLVSCSATEETSDEMTSKTIHVSALGNDKTADGSEAKPYASIQAACARIEPGTTVLVHKGDYEQFELTAEASGTIDDPVVVRAAEGERVVIHSKDVSDPLEEESIGIRIFNVDNITIKGFEIVGGTHGIYYESNADQGDKVLKNINFVDCTIHRIRGLHGVCVYAANDLAPVKKINMTGCEIYDCECYWSESTVFNGNIDGFEISGNVIHDNNNIGIDMIGFEGTAKHTEGDFDNAYEVDFVRNGVCHDNVVYNISAEGNAAYLDDGEYDLCADGIYVDGGQDIEIYNNFVFNCNIGIEVATEHSPDDNPLFKVSGIDVHDNVVASCMGWCGLCFGGYDKDLGFTEECKIHDNTLVDNGTQIGVQRSNNNTLYRNLMVGGDTAIEFNYECIEPDQCNDFAENMWCIEDAESLEDYIDASDYSVKRLVNLRKQTLVTDRLSVIDGFTSLVKGYGSSWTPDKQYIDKYYKIVKSDK